jgi:hypothetical protein
MLLCLTERQLKLLLSQEVADAVERYNARKDHDHAAAATQEPRSLLLVVINTRTREHVPVLRRVFAGASAYKKMRSGIN